MTNTDSKAVTLYSDATQISPNCTLYPILITIRISDAQIDAQNVPVDGELLTLKLTVWLAEERLNVG